MLGHTELRTSNIWIELRENVTEASVVYWQKAKSKTTAKRIKETKTQASFPNIFKWQVTALEPGTAYQYNIVAGKENKLIGSGEFTTQSLWQHRTTPPDFSFLTGSCAYFNEPIYDRPGKPYGGDSSIFTTMAGEKDASFMLWLGDNWYTREVDYFSAWGMAKRPSHDRSFEVLQPLLKAMPHYAIWDDHDYGPNNADKSFVLKETSRKVFMDYWNNPSYGENGQGIYTRFQYNDVDFFLLDDRWFRSNDDMKDSIDGKTNSSKRMLGEQQMEWLKNSLLQSNASTATSFRIIAIGSQVLNNASSKDCFINYSYDFHELTNFLAEYNIKGVVFLTGDRHNSSVIKLDRPGTYTLYDITASSLTAGVSRRSEREAKNPNMVVAVEEVNSYSRISFTGKGRNRTMNVDFINQKGEEIAGWSIMLKDISPESK